MSIYTQIRSFKIPHEPWSNGYPSRPDLPPLVLPARDALDIERRASKGVNLRNEYRRYVLCCERIQGIVLELSQIPNLLPPPLLWSAHGSMADQNPTALAYLGIADFLRRTPLRAPRPDNAVGGMVNMDLRLASIFLPPEHIKTHLRVFDMIRGQPTLNVLFDRASKDATVLGTDIAVTPEQCQQAFAQRHELLRACDSGEYGLVDVIELI